MSSKPKRLRAVIFFLFLSSPSAQAVEVIPYTGMMDVLPVNGCCQHVSPELGYGLIARLGSVTKKIGPVEVAGFSNFKFTEGSIARYIYLRGLPGQVDPASTPEVSVTRYSDWTLAISYGAGFYTYNTKTKDYNLPTLVTGAQFLSRLVFSMTISDFWSVTGLMGLGLAYSPSSVDLNLSYGVGAAFRF